MNSLPTLDQRTSRDVYQQTIALLRAYCGPWYDPLLDSLEAGEDLDDVGLVLLQLFGQMTQRTLGQFNQIPLHRQLAFVQFTGTLSQPAIAARVPLSFVLRADAAPVTLPKGTKTNSQAQQQIVFETTEPVTVLPIDLQIGLGVHPQLDIFANHSTQLNGSSGPFALFPDPNTAEPAGHMLCIGDESLFGPDASFQKLSILLQGENIAPEWFANWYDGQGNLLQTNADTISLPSTQTPSSLAPTPYLEISFERPPHTKTAPIQTVVGTVLGERGTLSPKADGSEAQGVEAATSSWLCVTPLKGKRVLPQAQDQLPKLQRIWCKLDTKDIAPDHTISNQTKVQIKNGAFPFGRRPAEEDAFYICSDQIFSMQGSQITLLMEGKPLKLDASKRPTLAWEFWDGTRWISMSESAHQSTYNFQDSTDALCFAEKTSYGAGQISFTCPQIEQTSIAGQKGHWIRVRIQDGGYGEAFKVESKKNTAVIAEAVILANPKLPADQQIGKDAQTALIDALEKNGYFFGYSITETGFTPPFLQHLSIQVTQYQLPSAYRIVNRFQIEYLDKMPYKPLPGQRAAFYLGCRFDPSLLGRDWRIFFDIDAVLSASYTTLNEQLATKNRLIWQYWDGLRWQNLKLIDNTQQLSHQGILQFTLPTTAQTLWLFGKRLLWLRAQRHSEEYAAPLIQGMYPNAVDATNTETHTDEILGSGHHAPGEVLTLQYTPVVGTPEIWIRERIKPLPSANSSEATTDNTQAIVDEAGRTIGYWVQWKEVASFLHSGSKSRHYVLNRQTGQLQFGDGVRGMTLPAGVDNAMARRYISTHGSRGNLAAHAIDQLPEKREEIASLFNPVSATGGDDHESQYALLGRGKTHIVHRNRAILQEDFATLLIDLLPAIYRTSAMLSPSPTLVGEVQTMQIAILPHATGAQPMPTAELLAQAQNAIESKLFVPLKPKVQIVSPVYKPISFVVSVLPDENTQPTKLKDALTAQLTEELYPVEGNRQANANDPIAQELLGPPPARGWDFGATLLAASFRHFLMGLDGIKSVGDVFLGDNESQITLGWQELPTAGTIDVVLLTPKEWRDGHRAA